MINEINFIIFLLILLYIYHLNSQLSYKYEIFLGKFFLSKTFSHYSTTQMLTSKLSNNSTRIYFFYIKIHLKQCTCGKIWSGIFFNPTFTFSMPQIFFSFSSRFNFNRTTRSAISNWKNIVKDLPIIFSSSSSFLFSSYFLDHHLFSTSRIFRAYQFCFFWLLKYIYCEIYHLFRRSCVCFVKIF
jgi:hypothetical protein